MEDEKIIDLYFMRSEEAITQTDVKYGRYCHTIAFNILYSREDSEECVNDTWLHAWNAMPPQRPGILSAFLGKITRNLALNMYEKYNAKKRGSGETAAALEELEECVPSGNTVEQEIENMALSRTFDRFLAALPERTRKIFVRRYWYVSPVKEIADDLGMTESNVKMTLLRTRKQFRTFLESEGIVL